MAVVRKSKQNDTKTPPWNHPKNQLILLKYYRFYLSRNRYKENAQSDPELRRLVIRERNPKYGLKPL